MSIAFKIFDNNVARICRPKFRGACSFHHIIHRSTEDQKKHYQRAFCITNCEEGEIVVNISLQPEHAFSLSLEGRSTWKKR